MIANNSIVYADVLIFRTVAKNEIGANHYVSIFEVVEEDEDVNSYYGLMNGMVAIVFGVIDFLAIRQVKKDKTLLHSIPFDIFRRSKAVFID